MKVINITFTKYNNLALLRKANSQAQRSLAGYIIKSGHNDALLGGAYRLLRQIEHCMDNEEIYVLNSNVDFKSTKEIINIAQSAIDGEFDKFEIQDWERRKIIKYLCEHISPEMEMSMEF